MDQYEWGLLHETVRSVSQAGVPGGVTGEAAGTGAGAGVDEDTGRDTRYEALLAAIGRPEHPQSKVAGRSAARRTRVDLIRQRVRVPQTPHVMSGADAEHSGQPVTVSAATPLTTDDPDWEHPAWLTPALTQLPTTTREVVSLTGTVKHLPDAPPSGHATGPAITDPHRSWRHPGRRGALPAPIGALRKALPLRLLATMAGAFPLIVTAVLLLPAEDSQDGQPGSLVPSSALPQPSTLSDLQPRSAGPGSPSTGAGAAPRIPASGQQLASGEHSGASAGAGGVGGGVATGSADVVWAGQSAPANPARTQSGAGAAGPSALTPPPQRRTLPPQQCHFEVPVLSYVGCVVVDRVNGMTRGFGTVPPLSEPAPDPVG